MERVQLSDLVGEYIAYHSTNFGDTQIASLDITAAHFSQHTEFYLGERSAAAAMLVLKLLRKIARDRRVTLLLIVPFNSTSSDLEEIGFVKSSRGWCAAC
jgi:hypothetical protein